MSNCSGVDSFVLVDGICKLGVGFEEECDDATVIGTFGRVSNFNISAYIESEELPLVVSRFGMSSRNKFVRYFSTKSSEDGSSSSDCSSLTPSRTSNRELRVNRYF